MNGQKPQSVRYMTADELFAWRLALDMTQTEASAALGVPYGSYCNWEKGHRRCPAMLAPACERLTREG